MLRAIALGLGSPVLAVFLVASVAALALHRPLARRAGWRPWPLLGAGISLAAACSVTLTPVGSSGDFGYCVLSVPA